MTEQEFLRKYHSYRTLSEVEAYREATRINAKGIDNDYVRVIKFRNWGWGLILASKG